MEDRTILTIVKIILVVYNLLMSLFWFIMIKNIVNNEYLLFKDVSNEHLFVINIVIIAVMIIISLIGMVAVIKEWYHLAMTYAILETIFLVALVIFLVFYAKNILLLAITIAVQASIIILAFGFAVAIAENRRIDKIKIQHNYV